MCLLTTLMSCIFPFLFFFFEINVRVVKRRKKKKGSWRKGMRQVTLSSKVRERPEKGGKQKKKKKRESLAIDRDATPNNKHIK